MKYKSLILTTIHLIFTVYTAYAHPIMQKPLYNPDREYEKAGRQKPKIPNWAIAMIDNKYIGRSDYINWLVDRAGKEELFEQFITDILIEQKARQLGIRANRKEIQRMVEEKTVSEMEKARSSPYYKTMIKMSAVSENEFLNLQKVKIRKEVEKYYIPSLIIYHTREIPESSIRKKFVEKYGKDGRKYLLKCIFVSAGEKLLKKGEPGYDNSIAEMEREAKDELGRGAVELKQGRSFEETAQKYSDDEETKYNGGYLGEFIKGKFGGEFDQAVQALAIGETSRVLKSRRGFHIVKVINKTGDRIEISHIQHSVNWFSVPDLDFRAGEREKAREKIDRIFSRIKAGEDFYKIAEEESDNPEKSYRDGFLEGWSNNWDIMSGSSLTGLQKGDTSSIIETDRGFQIVRIEDLKATEYSNRIKESLKKEIAYDTAVKEFSGLKKDLINDAKIIRY